MSAALLKKSLELCDTPFVVVSDKRELRYKAFIDQSKPQKTQRGVSDVERKNITCIEQVKKKRKQQKKKEETLRKKLEVLRKPVVDERLAKTILESTKKRGDSDREVIFLKDNQPEQKSIFSEEDFARGALLVALSGGAYVIATFWCLLTPLLPYLAGFFPPVKYYLLFFGTCGLIFIGSLSVITIYALWAG
ncbi:hypothetical protein GE061_003132 [Apolygus lucorum]|uniref:Uncharacterized protein n=1 Tax=Apolygus lucorum TaxID=248454 RepID=A0A6A4JL02_APOLU|nr:hypothetical protein GE061_003132 [Apolygus lucorum]